MTFICTDVVKHPGTIIMIFEPANAIPDKAYQFKSAAVTGAKLVAVDPYGVITILYDPEAVSLPTLGTVTVLLDNLTISSLSPSASDAGMFEPGTTLSDAS